jgi:hypothetical protein
MLDFSQVTAQIQTFTQEQVRAHPQWKEARDEAGRRLRASAPAWEQTADKIALSRTSWLVADWLNSPETTTPAPPRPMPCVVFAADGSQIVADRHDIALCYLLNIGFIALRYGTGERATLTSRPQLAFPDDDLLDEFQGEQAAIVPRRLGVRRLLAEVAGLTEMIEKEAASTPNLTGLALFDGSLILWMLETEQEQFRLDALDAFQSYLESARKRRVPFAGYISKPMSRDVVNALSVFRCPHPEANCDTFCPNRSKPKPIYKPPDCAGTGRVTDAELFALSLQPGQRSAVFGSQSKILKQYDPIHRIRFFYLHTGREVARVEIPDWVAEDAELLDRTHALCYDQTQKGDGYPVALAEAHEQAIVRGAERTAFFHLMEQRFVTSHLPLSGTQKAVSKRARRV